MPVERHLSADGYFATEDGKLEWVVPDEELTRSNLRNMAEADTILFVTHEMFESFWPKAITIIEAANPSLH